VKIDRTAFVHAIFRSVPPAGYFALQVICNRAFCQIFQPIVERAL
jgi:hypothetical protein